jgi:sortase A
MNPDKSRLGGDLQAQPHGGAPGDDTSVVTTPETTQSQQMAAANVIRSRIDHLYESDLGVATEVTPTEPNTQNVYHRTHTQHPLPEAEQWKQYHSAWQNYYQKYYENYYTAQTGNAKPSKNTAAEPAKKSAQEHYFRNQPNEETTEPESLSNDQALFELREKLLGRVQESAQKIRKSRHFIPILSALTVVLLFVFVQYNQVFIANVKAYVSPGNIDPQNIVIDPTADIVVSSEPRLIIPKINVDVPVAYDVSTDYDAQMAAMANGLAHFPIPGANSHPGEVGNTALAGHSSNDLFDVGDYKFIFAQLDKLAIGDTIYANYESKRYTYVVSKIEVVKPTEVNALVYPTTKPLLTLITCTPLGTALNRLLVTAEQVSPDPIVAAKAPEGSGVADTSSTAIPGNSGTLLEKLFGTNR